MRNFSLAIIALTVLLVSIFPNEHVANSSMFDPIKSPHGADFKVSCNTCHSTKGWIVDKEKITFNHNSTKMPLVGQHAQIDCKLCHPTLVFSEAKTECSQCHTDVHESGVGTECSRCHTPHSWLVNNITQIHQQSRFPLVGVHATVNCEQCHTSETSHRFDVMGTECSSCHMDDYAATTQPNHAVAGYSTECFDCHTIFAKEWKGTGFNHNFFPLNQGHDIDDCSKCHVNGNFTNTSRECISCHQSDYSATTNPNHITANYSTDCIRCHTTAPGWKPALFDHSQFPLTRGHDVDDCSKCHVNGNYSNTSSDCISCHRPDYIATTNPNHVSANFSTNCTQCHSTEPGWKPATFDHSKFPLTQGHNIDECSKCHINGNYSNTSSECASCHQADYNGTTNPNHVSAGFSVNCNSCHTTVPGWKPATFDHSKFPLTQGHNIDECSKCHINGNYSNTSSECASCHQADYNGTTNPNHVSAGFSVNCNSCHTTVPGWKPATFDHSKFPLTQGHNIDECSKCHINGNYSNTSNECVSCHQTDYNGTTNPNHVNANYSTNCIMCHTTAPGWKPATFDHSKFPLTQGHNIDDCSKCHVDGNYTNTSSDCKSCHQTDYNATTNPSHSSLNFSTACSECHTTAPGWKPARYTQHDALSFPIYSGKHQGEWNSCTDCHTNTSNYKVFSCIDCHEHNKADMDSKHQGENGYVYSSASCLNCHPQGRAD